MVNTVDNKGEMRITSIAAPVRFQVASSFRSAILSGRFKPGERLVEKDLCELTGASRTSVREALRQLEAEGLVEMVPNKGPIVTDITPAQARSIYEVRGALEALAGTLFTERANVNQHALLVEAVETMATAYQSANIEMILQAKDAFYEVLLEGSGNEIIGSTLRMMHARVSLLRRVSLGREDRLAASLAEIQTIVAAVKAGDVKMVAERCQAHVRNAANAALNSLSDFT